MSPVSILMVVVLPAPLGPRKPKISPASTVNEIPLHRLDPAHEEPLAKVFSSSLDLDGRASSSPPSCRPSAAPCRASYSCSLYWILRELMPSTAAAFDVEPPHISSVFRMANRSISSMRRARDLRRPPGSALRRDAGRQVAQLDPALVAEHDRALDGVLELAHVARPARSREQRASASSSKPSMRLPFSSRVAREEERRERGRCRSTRSRSGGISSVTTLSR